MIDEAGVELATEGPEVYSEEVEMELSRVDERQLYLEGCSGGDMPGFGEFRYEIGVSVI